MAWNDRIREAAYNSPSGARLRFAYEDVRRSVEKKTSAFDFPDVDGTYVQDLGSSGRRYPLRVFFWGADYDLEANRFETALLERGQGRLEHPLYGSVDVVPFGSISRRDDLKTAANQAILEVTFWETTGVVYPTSRTDPASAVLRSVDEFNAAAAAQLEGGLSLETAVEPVSFKNNYLTFLDNVQNRLAVVADVQQNVADTFEDVFDSISLGIDTLIGEPITLAFQTMILIQTPARSSALIGARLDAYADLAGSIIGSNTLQPTLDSSAKNQLQTRDLYLSGYVSGSVVSAVNAQFQTRRSAIEAADAILAQLEAAEAWREANYAALGVIDTGGSYQQLQEAAAIAAGFLVDISFSLNQERTIVLDRARTMIDLVAELYGGVDEFLDFFIDSNNLTGSEILEIPRGREIVYYV